MSDPTEIARRIMELTGARRDEPLGPGQVMALGMTPDGIAAALSAVSVPTPLDVERCACGHLNATCDRPAPQPVPEEPSGA